MLYIICYWPVNWLLPFRHRNAVSATISVIAHTPHWYEKKKGLVIVFYNCI
jgi:hypothetical protein